MKFQRILCSFLVLLINSQRRATAQLTVDLLKVENVDHISDADSLFVTTSYTFPTGFTNPLDWFTEPYANIPSTLTGILYHPIPHNACEPILDHRQLDCAAVCNETAWQALSLNGMMTFSKIALVDDYHVCTTKKLEHLQMAGFEAMVTFNRDNSGNQNVNNRVYDETADSYVDVVGLQFPVAVISETFSKSLIMNATYQCTPSSDCQHKQPMALVRIKSDSSRQGWIQIAIGVILFVLVVGVPLITCVLVCFSCLWCCSGGCGRCNCKESGCGCIESCRDCCSQWYEKCKKSGTYEVHELQHQVLGGDDGDESLATTPTRSTARQSSRREEYLRERMDSLHNMRRRETEQDENAARSELFRRTYEICPSNEREFKEEEKDKYKACAICLCDFEVGERVRVLPCDDSHFFHVSCIEQWLQTNSVCPVCRTFITIPNH